MKLQILALLLLIMNCCVALHDEQTDFFKSFIRNYGLSAHARDTREYHPYILARAQQSMVDMEHAFKAQGFNLIDRIVVMGYQQDAIPDYYCSSEKKYIDDEVAIKQNAGWVHASGNLFGFITGYILKNVSGIFEHIAPDAVGLFDARATLFAKHAFGAAYDSAQNVQLKITKAIIKKSYRSVLLYLEAFWKYLYVQQPLTVSGVALGTQDILFSLAHIRSLITSTIPVRKWFVGPDITYPIGAQQHALDATLGAQQCVVKMHEQLQPINDQTTAYILCSFVDGVGKSTLCANLLHYQQFGTQFQNYTTVDNSSSLQASYYHYTDNVILVDLPAQMSHYTIKPEGSVYVPIQATTIAMIPDNLISTALKHTHQKDSPEYQYQQLCSLLSVQNQYHACEYNGHHYIINPQDVTEQHVLIDLNEVQSKGLKVKQPERMLFSGVSFAQSANSLTAELIEQLQALQVENIVFIDCMGMYPRSSRENIRLNFLLQQLTKHGNNGFVMHPCFYAGLVNPQELYAIICKDSDSLAHSISKEAIMRYFFQQLMDNYAGNQITLNSARIDRLQDDYFTQLYEKHIDHVEPLVQEKIKLDFQEIKQHNQFNRIFQSIVLLDMNNVCKLSDYIQNLFAHTISNNYFNALWQSMQEISEYAYHVYKAGQLHELFVTPSGYYGRVVAVIPKDCKDQIMLGPIINQIRASWYAVASNLAGCEYDESTGLLVNNQIMTGVSPLIVVQLYDGAHIVLTRSSDAIQTQPMSSAQKLFSSVSNDEQNRVIKGYYYHDIFHAIEWSNNTNSGIYSFGLNQSPTLENNVLAALVKRCAHDDCEQYDTYRVLSVSALYQELVNKKFVEYAQKLAWAPCTLSITKQPSELVLQTMIRLYITIDAILKDPQAAIMICDENDIGPAAYLYEHITLPTYFSIRPNKPLFERYSDVSPIIPI